MVMASVRGRGLSPYRAEPEPRRGLRPPARKVRWAGSSIRGLGSALLAGAVAFGPVSPARAQASADAAGAASDVSHLGVPIYPGAVARAGVAGAIEAYYAGSLGEGERLRVAVFETPAAFEEVYEFYGPRMPEGKWGWRKKVRPLRHQTLTLRFYRRQVSAERGVGDGRVPEIFEPLLGDGGLTAEQFDERLRALEEAFPASEIQIVEGSRRVSGETGGAQVRLVVERPYIDLATMSLVDRTRIQILRVSR